MTPIQQVVAVKKLTITPFKDPERVLGVRMLPLDHIMAPSRTIFQLTIREANFLVELSHGNIINLEGIVEDLSNGIIWLVFPWAYNGNLREFILLQDWTILERISLVGLMSTRMIYL